MDSSENRIAKKKPMTDEERLALATKLDEELDEFIAGLKKRKYTEGWPEDRWEEEMEKHPFFMSKLPEDGTVPPLLEGLQKLKYDENENTPLELAKSYKDDGNFNFKYKKYRMAVLSYTEGIRRHCGDPEIEAQLYGNRAAAHFHLGNYRSSLSDCQQALKIKPEYIKAKIRAAKCCVNLKMHKEAKQYCDEILEDQPEEPTALTIRSEAVSIAKQEERNNRKQKIEDKKLASDLSSLKKAIESRNIRIEVDDDILSSPGFPQVKPTLENGELFWRVYFLYPEYSMAETINSFNENETLFAHLNQMFAESPEWDVDKKYRPEALALYYEGSDGDTLFRVDVNKTLLEILSNGQFVVSGWTVSFHVLVKGSKPECNFLKDYSSVLQV